MPIYQTTSISSGIPNMQTRSSSEGTSYPLMNPTTDVFEKRMALIVGGIGALAVSSGQSAITLAMLNIAKAGDEIVSMDNLYGGTYNLFRHTFARMGITVKFIRSNDLAGLEKGITKKTKAVYAESIGNPKLDVADREGIASIAHPNRILHLDASYPYLLNPLISGGHRGVLRSSSAGTAHWQYRFGNLTGERPFLITEPDELPRANLRRPEKAYPPRRG